MDFDTCLQHLVDGTMMRNQKELFTIMSREIAGKRDLLIDFFFILINLVAVLTIFFEISVIAEHEFDLM